MTKWWNCPIEVRKTYCHWIILVSPRICKAEILIVFIRWSEPRDWLILVNKPETVYFRRDFWLFTGRHVTFAELFFFQSPCCRPLPSPRNDPFPLDSSLINNWHFSPFYLPFIDRLSNNGNESYYWPGPGFRSSEMFEIFFLFQKPRLDGGSAHEQTRMEIFLMVISYILVILTFPITFFVCFKVGNGH